MIGSWHQMCFWPRGLIVLIFAIASMAHAAWANSSFYKGKQLVVLVNFSQGGPTDAEGRLLARHLARIVGGHPAVIVTNMAGDRGAAAANWLANVAAPDGLILGYFSGIASMRAFDDPRLSAGVANLDFIAAGRDVGVTYARTDIGKGLKSPTDFLKQTGFWVGGFAPDNVSDLRLRLQLDLLGMNYRYMSGFANVSSARVAIHSGEIQVLTEPMRSYRFSIEPGLVDEGKAIPLWVDPVDDGEQFTRASESEGIPAPIYTDYLRAARGDIPYSQVFDAYRLVNQMGTMFQRILVLAPGSPPEAVKALKAGMGRLAVDPAFKEDAQKSLKFQPKFVADEATEALFYQVVEPTVDMQVFLAEYIAKGRQAQAQKSTR
jgi:hypothetical protein